jgi:hypothetical protein
MPYGKLQIHEDLTFQYRSWRIRRVGWTVMGLILVAGALGLLGQGPLSRATTGPPGGPFQVDYERMAHYESTAVLRLHLTPEAVRDERATIRLGEQYVRHIQIEAITPMPASANGSSEGVSYVFHLKPGQPSVITFYLKLRQVGLLTGEVGIGDSPPVGFRQFVFP